jgi:hypothetical protein
MNETLNGLLEEKIEVTKDLVAQLQYEMGRDSTLKEVRLSGRGERRPLTVTETTEKKFNPYLSFKEAQRKKREWKQTHKEVIKNG